jgi:hypothetical protein
MKKPISWYFQNVIFFSGLTLLLSLFKISAIKGFQGFHFSGAELFTPLIGLYGGFWCTIIVGLVRVGIKFFIFKPEQIFTILSLKISSLCAAAYWAKDSFFTRFFIPALCIILFNFHPVGQQAWLYSCYWLIPLVLYWAPQKNIFVQAIASTFIAHGVGSVLWLYFMPMTAQMFIALIPIVFVERLLLASGMVVIVLAVELFKSLQKKLAIYFFHQTLV